LLKQPPELTVGPGTGVDKEGLARKRKAIYQALNRHGEQMNTPLDILERVGGLEIAGLVGAYIACAQAGVPILVDGFITTAAALLACQINPSARAWMMFSHKSAEPAHTLALDFLKASPLLDLQLRLGEGSGAAVAAPLVISALTLHNNMATFGSAGVSES
jgi:nicotinate-nucleotide--dimethylbenzimidazole phosphoribosyltransferase